VFEKSAEQGKSDVTDPVGFLKIRQKSVKIRKIQPKRIGDDGGTVKTGNTEMRPVSVINRSVLPINRPVLPINQCGEFRTVFAGNWPIFAEIR
jgi:hypothetical protein